MNQNEYNSLLRRLEAIESMINSINSILEKTATLRALSAIRVIFEERFDTIEAKNAELKNNYDYGNANACGKIGITIQGATTLFLANIKRIIKLEEEKNKNIG